MHILLGRDARVVGCAMLGFLGASLSSLGARGEPILRVEASPETAAVTFLSWDTEGGDRARHNLLRAPMTVAMSAGGEWIRDLLCEDASADASGFRYRVRGREGVWLEWRMARDDATATMTFDGQGCDRIRLVFPFDARVAATTAFPATWHADGRIELPAILSAPDFGQVLLSVVGEGEVTGELVGSRANHTVDFIIEFSPVCSLEFEPAFLPKPAAFHDDARWRDVRRGWFNIFQPSAQWGDPGHAHSAPPGILSNNVISDPVSCLIHLYADQAFFTPEATSGISLAAHVRRTVDYWILDKTRPTGEVVAYWDYGDMLDANASPLIAAWDYVESTGDTAWLGQRIERLEFIADYLAGRDTDGDGLIECTHSGNYGTLIDPARSASAYDTINAGHKDAYSNILAYRAWRCLADLEAKLGHAESQARYTGLADRLETVFFKTLYDGSTGWLAWWKSEDGELHNLASPMINALAIEYGLVAPADGRAMLLRLWERIEAIGFTRFDLGVPLTLVPVRKGDYLLPRPGNPASSICGAPDREDGTDTFGKYLNGGCCVSDAVHFMTALYMVDERAKGDTILGAMLERQRRGVFPNGGAYQNGIVDRYPEGAEFYDWNGNTCGYEGHLTYSFSFLQAVLLREPAFRDRLLRPVCR
ncbi:MAG TPA: hypothetical protein PLO37_13490 [Candidatus Hydrogenedentes bacterium]|nr:hypothetical protein [Candidatus Hydrogenedentota bacterium]HPG67857.1 hypothetical protein [Candidatus Hydrogenedentota bacterium]